MLAIFVVFNIHRLFGISGGSNFSGSTCLGDVLIFECSVTGGASTVWRGTVFNCSSSNNEIALLHSRFFNDSRSCNGVNIVIGQGLYVEHDQYISQLNVTINNYSALIGRNITCARDDGVVTYVVGYHNLSSNDLTCSNYSDISDTAGNGHDSMSTAMVIIVCSVLIAAAILVGTVFGVLVKKLLPCKYSFTLKHDLAEVDSEACDSPTVIGMKLEACDSKSLRPADSGHSIMTSAEQLPACDNDCNLDDKEERLDLNCLLMKLRGNVDPKLWYQFGMAIGVPEDVLEKLKGYDEEQCMIELADYWLRNHPTKPTWSKIYDTAKSLMKPMKFVNHYAVAQDLSGSKMRDACPQDSIILNYTAVIPKSIRSRLQRSVSPPPVPPRMDQLH